MVSGKYIGKDVEAAEAYFEALFSNILEGLTVITKYFHHNNQAVWGEICFGCRYLKIIHESIASG